jgi:hypothetical protein
MICALGITKFKETFEAA